MSFAVLQRSAGRRGDGFKDLGSLGSVGASAPVVSDLVGRVVANANTIIARGLISRNRIQYLPSALQAQAATQPVQAFIRMVTPAAPFMSEVISEANAMSGKLTRSVTNGRGGVRVIPMGVVQASDSKLDPVVRSVVVPLRLLVQWTTLRVQDPGLLMAAVGKVLVRQGLWPLERLQSFLSTLPSPSTGVAAMKSSIQRLGRTALDPGAVVQSAIAAGKDLVNRLTHVPGLSGGLGEGDDFEAPDQFGNDPSVSADTVQPIPEEPTADAPPTTGSAGDAPAEEAPPPVKDANKGTKATAGTVPQIIALINQLLQVGHQAQQGAAQAQQVVDMITGGARKGPQPAASKPSAKTIIPGVPDIAVYVGGGLAALFLLKK